MKNHDKHDLAEAEARTAPPALKQKNAIFPLLLHYSPCNIHTHIKFLLYIEKASPNPKAHQRARQALRNSLRFLPSHLNNAQQALNANIKLVIFMPEAGFTQHSDCALAIARAAEELYGLEDVVERVEVRDRRDAQFSVEGGEADIGEHRAEGGCCDYEQAAVFWRTLSHEYHESLKHRI